jgi:hypothetical protein
MAKVPAHSPVPLTPLSFRFRTVAALQKPGLRTSRTGRLPYRLPCLTSHQSPRVWRHVQCRLKCGTQCNHRGGLRCRARSILWSGPQAPSGRAPPGQSRKNAFMMSGAPPRRLRRCALRTLVVSGPIIIPGNLRLPTCEASTSVHGDLSFYLHQIDARAVVGSKNCNLALAT